VTKMRLLLALLISSTLVACAGAQHKPDLDSGPPTTEHGAQWRDDKWVSNIDVYVIDPLPPAPGNGTLYACAYVGEIFTCLEYKEFMRRVEEANPPPSPKEL
jgi:hypothetical protein